MTQIKRGLTSGWPYAQIWKVNGCYAYGQVPDVESISTPTTSHAYLINTCMTANLPQLTRQTFTFTGGGRNLGSTMFGANDIPSFTFECGDTDADLFALCTLSSVDQTTNTDWSTFGANEALASLPLMGFSLHANFQTFDEACDGEQKWLNIFFPACQIAPNFPSPDQFSGATTSFQVTPRFANKQINGDAFDSNQGFEGNRAIIYATISDYPIAVTTWFADGVATTFNTAYQPINTTVTVNDTPNHFAVNGTPTALTSIVVASGLATAAATGDDGDINVLMYETRFVAVT